MAEELRIAERPSLRRPILICAFRGWNDGGQGASMANGFLSRSWHAEKFASIDSESFFDFQSTRPHVTLVEGTVRRIDWPENVFEVPETICGMVVPELMISRLPEPPRIPWKSSARFCEMPPPPPLAPCEMKDGEVTVMKPLMG